MPTYIARNDEFLEKFQTAFDPHPSYSENHVAIFYHAQEALQRSPSHHNNQYNQDNHARLAHM